jgi:hypothetical protein
VSASISERQIQNFARAWYNALDIHAPVDACARLLADPGLEMIFPEKTLHGIADFEVWYSGGQYSDGSSAPGVTNIFFDESHIVQQVTAQIDGSTARVRVVVGWQASWFEAPAPKSKRTSLEAVQEWTVRRSERNDHGLEIVSYNAVAEPFKYAPGFAQL